MDMNILELTFEVPANVDRETQLVVLLERAIQFHCRYYLADKLLECHDSINRVLDIHISRAKSGYYTTL